MRLQGISPAESTSTGWAKKAVPQTHDHNSVKSLHDLQNFVTGRFFWVNLQYPTAPYTCCYTSLSNINASKKALNDKLQGSVAAYLRCGGVVHNQIKKGLLLSL